MDVTELGPITLAHDYFTQRGGAERVAAMLARTLHPTRLVTALHLPDSTFSLPATVTLETTFLQRFKAFRRDPRRALPLFPLAWSLRPAVAEGIAICSSSGWAHALRCRADVRKIVYCHNPARWLYQPRDYFRDQGAPLRLLMHILRPALRRWDKHLARSASLYIANSAAVADRIRAAYELEPVVVHPPISIDATGEQTPVLNTPSEYFLTVGRGRGYKHTDLLINAFAALPQKQLVVVGAPTGGEAQENVTYLKRVTDSELRWLYAHATALVSVAHEDFGLTPLEANAFGTPALALRAGGFLDSIDEGTSGAFINDLNPRTIENAIGTFPRAWNKDAIRDHAARFSPESFTERLISVLQDFRDNRHASPQLNRRSSRASTPTQISSE